MNKQKRIRQEKGITLIALIITIVVLLILAVTTIAAIQESDIIKYATDASNEHIIGQEKEQIQLAYNNYKIRKYTPIEKTEDQDELEEYFVGKNFIDLVEDLDANPWVIKYNNTEIIIPKSRNNVKEEGDNIYIYFEYNGYKYILTADANSADIKSLEIDKESITIPLEIEEAEVTAVEKNGWVVVFNKTGNRYNISLDGELELKNWDIAWTRDGTTWSEKYTSEEEITEEYKIIAKLFKTGGKIIGSDEIIEEYHMVIEGNGPIPSILNEKGELSSGVAWMKGFHVNNSSFEWFGVTKLTIGEGITSIPYGAFVYGLTLDSVILPSTLNIIEKEAFGMCANLTEITIPNSVEFIGSNCFVSCSNLITIYYNGTATGSPWGASNATVKSY